MNTHAAPPAEAPPRPPVQRSSWVAAALVSALWIATSAASPEFIWQGLAVFAAHVTWTDLVSALLIGLVLVFFIEPILQQLRALVGSARPAEERTQRNVPLVAAFGVLLGFTSVCLHDAMSAYASSNGESTGLEAALALTTASAIVPFAVTLAWQSIGRRWLGLGLALVAALSPFAAGWLFGWSPQTLIAAAVPCLAIFGLGYRQIRAGDRLNGFSGCARVLLGVAIVWFAVAVAFDAIVSALHAGWLALYGPTELLVDLRFYVGWLIGLLLVPIPSLAVRTPA